MKIKVERLGKISDINTKFGPKQKVSFFSEGKWLSTWMDKRVQNLQVGQELEGEIKSRDYNGKTYYDFELPKASKESPLLVEINTKLDLIIKMLARNDVDAPPPEESGFDGHTNTGGDVPF